MDYGIIKMVGQASLLLNPSAGELKLSASQKKFPENGLYLLRSVSMRSFNFSKKNLSDLNPHHRGSKTAPKLPFKTT